FTSLLSLPCAPSLPVFRSALPCLPSCCFSFHATAAPEIYTLSLHDALPISAGELPSRRLRFRAARLGARGRGFGRGGRGPDGPRSEEHTSELQSRENLVCRLLLEKKNREEHAIREESACNPTTAQSNSATSR